MFVGICTVLSASALYGPHSASQTIIYHSRALRLCFVPLFDKTYSFVYFLIFTTSLCSHVSFWQNAILVQQIVNIFLVLMLQTTSNWISVMDQFICGSGCYDSQKFCGSTGNWLKKILTIVGMVWKKLGAIVLVNKRIRHVKFASYDF